MVFCYCTKIYKYCRDVKIANKDGNEFIGEAQEVKDESEQSDYEKSEDGIIWLSEGKLIEFYQSEIQSIEKVSKYETIVESQRLFIC